MPTKNSEPKYRKSKWGAYPLEYEWAFSVIAPDGTRVTAGGYATEADAKRGARHQARFYDKLERDRVDGVTLKTTGHVLEYGIRNCHKCGEPHNLVSMTRRGKRWSQTWAKPGCGSYEPESWEELARRLHEKESK